MNCEVDLKRLMVILVLIGIGSSGDANAKTTFYDCEYFCSPFRCNDVIKVEEPWVASNKVYIVTGSEEKLVKSEVTDEYVTWYEVFDSSVFKGTKNTTKWVVNRYTLKITGRYVHDGTPSTSIKSSGSCKVHDKAH